MEIYNPSGKQMQKRELFRNASKDFEPTKTYAFSLRRFCIIPEDSRREGERKRGERGLLLNISIIISKLFYFGTVQKCCA